MYILDNRKLKAEETVPVDLTDTAGGDGKGVNNLPWGVEGDYLMLYILLHAAGFKVGEDRTRSTFFVRVGAYVNPHKVS